SRRATPSSGGTDPPPSHIAKRKRIGLSLRKLPHRRRLDLARSKAIQDVLIIPLATRVNLIARKRVDDRLAERVLHAVVHVAPEVPVDIDAAAVPREQLVHAAF